jgi:hypothetical protein
MVIRTTTATMTAKRGNAIRTMTGTTTAKKAMAIRMRRVMTMGEKVMEKDNSNDNNKKRCN